MERRGVELTHVYGLTEVYGPASVCAKQPEWDELPLEDRVQLNARQGVRYPVLEVEATVERFENGRGYSLRVLRAGKPRQKPDGLSRKAVLPVMDESC